VASLAVSDVFPRSAELCMRGRVRAVHPRDNIVSRAHPPRLRHFDASTHTPLQIPIAHTEYRKSELAIGIGMDVRATTATPRMGGPARAWAGRFRIAACAKLWRLALAFGVS
jgi:hypothetical protein